MPLAPDLRLRIRGLIDMKMISKTGKILRSNSGETMVEVIVAFTLLTIMLVVFAEGLAWATKSETEARERRNAADQGMIDLQNTLAREATPGASASHKDTASGFDGITRCEYVANNGQTYIVYQPAG